jgi:hypothetical protein
MSFSRIFVGTSLLVLAATAGVRAASFDGIYVNGDGGNVAYFDLMRTGDRLTGDYTVVVRNPESSGGILRSHFTVSGTADEHGALLTIVGETPESQAAMSYRWISRMQATGFTVEIPVATGHIATPFFVHSSIAGVNRQLAVLGGAVDRELQIRLDKLAMLRTEQALHADLAVRLRALSAVVKASADLDHARNRKATLEATVADLQRESEDKHRLAGGQDAAALDRTRRQTLADLQDQANYTDYALASAKADALGAQGDLASASQSLELAKRNLDEDDTRIASLLAMLVRVSAETH